MQHKHILENMSLLILICIGTFISTDISFDYPEFVHEMIDEPLYKIIIFGLILYVSTKSISAALLLTIIVVLAMIDIPMVSESFSGPPLNYCPAYGNKDRIEAIGTAYYPLNDTNELQKMRGGDDSENPPYEPTVSYKKNCGCGQTPCKTYGV